MTVLAPESFVEIAIKRGKIRDKITIVTMGHFRG